MLLVKKKNYFYKKCIKMNVINFSHLKILVSVIKNKFPAMKLTNCYKQIQQEKNGCIKKFTVNFTSSTATAHRDMHV